MAAFLLWNVQNANRDLLVQSIVREHAIDIVLLVEYSPTKTGSDLSNLLQGDGLVKRSISERFGVFGRLSDGMILSPVTIGTRLELWDWTPASGVGGRFALVHGLDRVNNDDGTRRVFFRRVADLVKAAEANSHRRSIVIGDFNAQPFESAILSSDGLHAIGIRHESNQTSRAIRLTDDREEFFYTLCGACTGTFRLRKPEWRRIIGRTGSLESSFGICSTKSCFALKSAPDSLKTGSRS